MSLAEHLNRLDAASLRVALERCCASRAWIAAMERCRPFADDQALLSAASEQWWNLSGDDWREAFAAHPQIGNLASLKAKYANTQTWAGGEQAGVAAAADATLERLAQLNREYREHFGYIFIVCATGKSAEEMLALLQQRLPNSEDAELRIAADEQLKITLLRFQKLTV